jgi:hypothetical protein
MSAGELTVFWSERQALENLDGDDVLLREVIVLMIDYLQQGLEPARVYQAGGDFAGLRRLTHALLPSLRMLGLEPQALVWEAFEFAVLAGDDAGSARLAHDVMQQWPQILLVFRSYLA